MNTGAIRDTSRVNRKRAGTGPRGTASALLLALAASEGPGEPPPPRIAQTQLTLRVGPVQGQATVVRVDGKTLTVVTAAHVLATGDVGKDVLVRQHDRTLKGRVVAVTRNPAFRPVRSRRSPGPSNPGTIGVDTEVASIEVEPRGGDERRAFEKIRPADLTTRRVPGSPGQIVWVHIQDQFGEEHVVRAGNHLNSQCLAWGRRGYDARPGDSGSGVFVMRETAQGGSRPLLIGNVAQTDGRGGIASLAHRDAPWLAKALEGARPGTWPAPSVP